MKHPKPVRLLIMKLCPCLAAALAVIAVPPPAPGQDPCIRVNAAEVTGQTSRYLTGVAICDVNHEVYGGLYSQLIIGEHFAEPAMQPPLKGFDMWGGGWTAKDGGVEVDWTWNSMGTPGIGGGATDESLLLCKDSLPAGEVSTEVLLNGEKARGVGLLVRGWKRPDIRGGPTGLVVLLDARSKEVQLGVFDLKQVPFITPLQSVSIKTVPMDSWIKLSADWNETEFNVSVNGTRVLSRGDLSLAAKGAHAWGLISPRGQGRFRNLSRNGSLVSLAPESEATKDDQVSLQWQPIRKGDVRGRFSLVSDKPLAGKQCQRMELVGGQGVVGLSNQGLHRSGLNFVAGKDYEGVLFARAAKPVRLKVAMESADGLKTYAQQELSLSAGEWQKLEFKLIPDAADDSGRFAVLLNTPGTVDLGYAFLQPGTWGRYKGLPVRRDIMEEMLANGVSAIRFSAALAWTNDKRWKREDSGYYWKMASGPRELRRPFSHVFNSCASGGWSWLEMLALCAAADILPIPDFSMMEKPQDLLDFIEYANGPADSPWGKVRASNGHPEPFNLRHIQLGNEWLMDEAYWKLFEPIAEAIWTKDPRMIIVVGSWGIESESHPVASQYRNILRLAKKHDAEVWFDNHMFAGLATRDTAEAISNFVKVLHKLADGAKFKAVPLELNASGHNVLRALGVAKILGELSELNADIPLVCGSNAMESDLFYNNGWSLGLIFFNAQKAWSQPPGHAMRMIATSRLPLRIKSEVTGVFATLYAAAERDEVGKRLTLRVVNGRSQPVNTKIVIHGFGPFDPEAQVSELSGALTAVNSAENPEAFAARPSRWKHAINDGVTRYTFPPDSFTVLQFTRNEGDKAQ